VTISAQILDFISDMKVKFGTAILLITHNLGIVAENCDRVAVLYAGKIVEIADMKTIFRKPKHPYTQGLLDAVPVLGIHKDRLEAIPGAVPSLAKLPTGCRFQDRCSFVSEICKIKDPQLLDAGNHQKVACHLYS
jgi:oligopeptide/dipeptide ABC transporter ATP-binding protein